jgi:PAS domain S-box-containing protein
MSPHGDAQQQYEQLVASINGIVWEVDAQTFLFTFVSRQAERLLGYPLEQWRTPGFWVDHLHPEDRDWALECCLRATCEKRSHECEYRMIAADGRTVWLRNVVSVAVEEDVATKLRGVMIDITERKRVEAALRQREADLQLALDAGRLGEWNWDLVAGRLTWSPFCKALYGLPADADVTYERFLAAIHPDDRARVDAALARALETRSDYEVEQRVVWPDGSVHWNVGRGRVFCDGDGQPMRMTGVAMDVTERKQAEDALSKVQRQLLTLVEHFPDFIARFDRGCRRLYVNPSVTRAFGLPLEHFVGKSLQELAMPGPPGQNEALQARIRQAVDQGLANTIEAQWETTRGERILEVRHIPEKDESGRVVSVLAIGRDVTERRQAEEALRHSEEEARNRLAEIEQIYRYAPIGLFAIDREYRFTRINEFLAEINGSTIEEHIGKTLWDMVPNLANHLVEIYRPVLERGESVLGQEIHGQTPKSPGVDRVWLANYFPFIAKTGEVIGLIGVVLEVTERKRAEEAVRKSEELLRQAVRVANLGIFDHDQLTDTIYWSPEQRAIYGWVEDRTSTLSDFVAMLHPEDRERIAAAIRRAHDPAGDGVFSVEQRIIRSDGEVRWLVTRSQTFFEGEGDARRPVRTVGAVLDSTEWKRVEERLAEAQEIGGFGSFEVDVTTWVGHCSPALCRILGFETDEPFQDFPAFICRHVHGDDREMTTKTRAQLLDEGGLDEIEFRYRRPDGEERALQARRRAVRTAAGRVIRLVGTIQDVTQRKRAEETLRASLREKEVLLKEVHHRVKNNLQLISSLLSLQASQIKDRVAAAAFTEAQNRVRTMALVHENLYRTGDLASVRLAGHLESLCAHLFRSYKVDPDRIVLELRVADVTLDLDRSIRLGLLVNELVANVLKHAFPAERSGRVLVQLDRPGEGWYTLVVSDNGVGLPPHLAPGHSDSLGLQLIADLAEQLGGTIVVDRAGGTTFSIRFPAYCHEESRS